MVLDSGIEPDRWQEIAVPLAMRSIGSESRDPLLRGRGMVR